VGALSEPAVELRDVFCVHRTAQGDAAALQGLDLEFDRGEIVCVLGPSGAGKSTLLRVIAGIQLPTAGTVRILGRDISRVRPVERFALRHRHLGYLGQSSEEVLPPGLTAGQAIVLPLALRGVDRGRRRARAMELLEAVGLADRADARPGELSGGERQRVAACVAVAHRPAVLLADEPTGDLDRTTAATVYELFVSLVRAEGAGAVIVSHDPLAAWKADRVIGLRDGRVTEEREHGATSLVVGRDGWVRIPSSVQNTASLGSRLVAQMIGEGLLLSPAPGASRPLPGDESRRAVSIGIPGHRAVSVELKGVSRSYGRGPGSRPVLAELSHVFPTGQLTVVSGRSGSGKTTLLRLIAGLDRPRQGEITLDGTTLADNDEQRATQRRQRIGFMAQDPAPVVFLSCHENVVLTLRMRGWDQKTAAKRAADVLELTGLSERARQRVHRLSAGEMQRLALARALAGARGLLIIDEPTSRLDEANARAVARLLGHAAADNAQTVICATHDPMVIGEAADVLALG
jgi:ABC-type lipoprotein export system ATPase subunit